MSSIEEFLRRYKSKKTVVTYRSSLHRFFQFLCPDADHDQMYSDKRKVPLSDKQQIFIDTYFTTQRDYETDVLRYWNHISGQPPKSIHGRMAAIKSFLINNDVTIRPRILRDIAVRTPPNKAITWDTVPTHDQMKSLLSHASLKGKALFLMMLSSGMRPEEAVQLTFDDIDFDSEPTIIRIPAHITKTKTKRITFMSTEATEAVKEWLKVRDKFIDTAVKKNYAITGYEHKIFPFTYNTSYAMWNRLLEKAQLDQKDNGRYKIHMHCLRKFFRTNMAKAIEPDVVESLMGHEHGTTAAYRKYSDDIDSFKQLYLSGQDTVLIFSRALNQEKIDSLQEQIQSLNNQMEQLLEFKERITDTDSDYDELGDELPQEPPLPNEVIVAAFQQEQDRKKEARTLARKLDIDVETAIAILQLKKDK